MMTSLSMCPDVRSQHEYLADGARQKQGVRENKTPEPMVAGLKCMLGGEIMIKNWDIFISPKTNLNIWSLILRKYRVEHAHAPCRNHFNTINMSVSVMVSGI